MPKFYEQNALDSFPLEKGSVNCVITSPPYFNLRDYKGDPRQIGLESSPEEYVEKMVQVSANIKEALAKDGNYFLNIGDTYNSKNKCLMLVPHMTALGLIKDGWILRNTIIWHKPNHMPCSIKDRLTPAHEYIFHFVKSKKYYYNLDAIREPHQTLDVTKHMNNPNILNKVKDAQVNVAKQESLFDMLPTEELPKQKSEYKDGYTNSKLHGESDKNIGARGGFAIKGETVENRYADGGKNPGDVFLEETEERKFTREDELRAEKEFGYTRHAAARVTARLRMGLAQNHPLGKNPGDVFSNSATEQETQRKSPEELITAVEVDCPDCGSQFITDLSDFYMDNPEDLWSINTAPYRDAHYAVFPPKLVRRMILCGSAPGHTVLDPFSGSGTTAITAEQLGRIGIGFDLSYNDVRARRVAKGIQDELIKE